MTTDNQEIISEEDALIKAEEASKKENDRKSTQIRINYLNYGTSLCGGAAIGFAISGNNLVAAGAAGLGVILNSLANTYRNYQKDLLTIEVDYLEKKLNIYTRTDTERLLRPRGP